MRTILDEGWECFSETILDAQISGIDNFRYQNFSEGKFKIDNFRPSKIVTGPKLVGVDYFRHLS